MTSGAAGSHGPDPRGKAAPIWISGALTIDPAEIEESFVRAAGPGGQHVNKTSTAVQLRFDVRRSPNLPGDVRVRLERLAGRRLTREGVLVITAQRHRTQERNRADALDRLVELIQRAAVAPIPRRPTKPTRGSRERRIESKKRRSSIKGLRQVKPAME
jgi:ribosome-associated protein